MSHGFTNDNCAFNSRFVYTLQETELQRLEILAFSSICNLCAFRIQTEQTCNKIVNFKFENTRKIEMKFELISPSIRTKA